MSRFCQLRSGMLHFSHIHSFHNGAMNLRGHSVPISEQYIRCAALWKNAYYCTYITLMTVLCNWVAFWWNAPTKMKQNVRLCKRICLNHEIEKGEKWPTKFYQAVRFASSFFVRARNIGLTREFLYGFVLEEMHGSLSGLGECKFPRNKLVPKNVFYPIIFYRLCQI